MKELFEFRNIMKLSAASTGIFICLRYAAECSEGIRKGILFCIEVLVPSLFLFMAMSSYIVKSGIAVLLTQPFKKISHLLFRLPPCGLAVILLSAVGGYPVGARCGAILYEEGQLSADEAEKAVYIAVCAGPGFLMNYIGVALLHNRKAGMLLLAAESVGMLLTGMIVGHLSSPQHTVSRPTKKDSSDNLLLSSVLDASSATFRMCSMVVICAAAVEVIAAVTPAETFTDIAAAVLEITTGCQRMCGRYPLYLVAFFVGFGGISVHLQIYAGLGKLQINKGLFFLYRIIQGIITAALAYILLMIFPIEQSVFNSTDAPLTIARSATLIGSSALIFTSLCFLGSVHQIRRKSDNRGGI